MAETQVCCLYVVDYAGDIFVNGVPKQQATWAKQIGYVEQMVSEVVGCCDMHAALCCSRPARGGGGAVDKHGIIDGRLAADQVDQCSTHVPQCTALPCCTVMSVVLVAECDLAWLLLFGASQDIHSSNTTVEEALWFSGRLRLPPSVSDAQVCAGAGGVAQLGRSRFCGTPT